MDSRLNPKTMFTSRNTQPYQAAEIAQADADYGQIRARLGDHCTDQELMEAALRLCFADATGVTVMRRRRDR